MVQIEAKAQDDEFDTAVAELRAKMADWTPALHRTRGYMLCCAVAGKRLRFYAVMRGGLGCTAISREYDRTLPLHRLEVRGWEGIGSSCITCEHDLVQVTARIRSSMCIVTWQDLAL